MKRYYILLVFGAICFYNTALATYQNLHGYMWANYQQFAGNMKTAQNWYTHLLSNNSSIYTYKGFIDFLYKTNNYQQIVSVMNSVGNTFDNDPDVQIIFGHALHAVGKNQEGNALFIKLSRQFKNNLEIVFEAAKAYLMQKELENALQVIDTLLNTTPKKPNYFVLYFLKAQINMQLNRLEQALKNVQESIAIHPHFDKSWLLFGILQEKQGMLQDAIKGYTSYLETTEQADKQIEQHLLKLLLQQKTQQHNTNTSLFNKTCYQKALILFERKQYKQALEQIDNCLKLNTEQTDSQLLKIQILHSMQAYEEATNTLVQWLNKNPDNTILLGTLHLLARSGAPLSPIINAFEQLAQKNPANQWPPLYLADLYTRVHNSEKALTYHAKALKLVTDIKLRSKIHFQMGILHYERQEYDAMLTLLENARSQGSDFPPLLNLLAYYYATKGKQLPKAQELITQTLKQDPNNPHFLDTQATIWYKQGNINKAYKLLSHLARNVPDDAMILIHLGKMYHKL
ncbi:MAG: hypothetical protein Q8Q25_01920, partial [bacterium]|nr:hypothetical protein [bacterium]